MEIDIAKGISLKIEGELGKYQTLPIETLIKIADSLQNLILTIAKYDLPSDEPINLNNFKLELSEFEKGSAIPSFVLTERTHPTIASDFYEQRKCVGKQLNKIFEISEKGAYYDLKSLYAEPLKRNQIVENLYSFTSSFNNSPISIFERGCVDSDPSFIKYSIKKFKSATKKDLITNVEEAEFSKEEEIAYASIKVIKSKGKTRNKIQDILSNSKHSLSYSPELILVNGKEYLLQYPLRCLFEKEDDYYIINNEQLDIIGTGMSQDEAELNFNEEFDYLYTRLNSLNDDQLNGRLLRIKGVLNSFVKQLT